MNNQLPILRMKANRMNQTELAELAGVGITTVVKWEKDIGKMTVAKLLLLCNHFNVTPNELLNYKEEGQ